MTWDDSTSGLLVLPSGRRVRGRSLRRQPSGTAEVSLQLTLLPPRSVEPAARWICWPDFGLPIDSGRARRVLTEVHGRLASARVEVCCGGGVGRTGTALAALAILDGLRADEAVTWVRRGYHPRAVETPWQRSWLRALA